MFRYGPMSLPVSFIQATLAFSGPSADKDWSEFSAPFGLTVKEGVLDLKASKTVLPLTK